MFYYTITPHRRVCGHHVWYYDTIAVRDTEDSWHNEDIDVIPTPDAAVYAYALQRLGWKVVPDTPHHEVVRLADGEDLGFKPTFVAELLTTDDGGQQLGIFRCDSPFTPAEQVPLDLEEQSWDDALRAAGWRVVEAFDKDTFKVEQI